MRAEGFSQEIIDLQREELDIEAERISRIRSSNHLEPFVERMTPDFQPGWHITEMCEMAEKLEFGTRNPRVVDALRRLIVTMPPRHAKSQTYSRCLPLWYLARNPSHEVMVICYGDELAKEHGDWCKNASNDPLFKQVFPDLIIRRDSKSKNRMLTNKGGGIRFLGTDAAITGKGAHLLIIDDPIKNSGEADSLVESEKLWKNFWTGMMTRLAPGAAVVVMHTRWHTADLIGRILTQEKEKKKTGPRKYVQINYPAIAEEDEKYRKKGEALHPARFTLEELQELQENMARRDWLALYQQRPVDEEGNFFKNDHFNFYSPEQLPKTLYIYISTDFAVSTKSHADFTCIWPYGVDTHGNIWFLADFVHAKLDSGASVRALVDLAKRHQPIHVEIEAGVIRAAIGPIIDMECDRQKTYFSIVSPNPAADKITRAVPAQAMFEMGKIYLPDTQRVHFNIVPELLAFDKGIHDDAVDTIAMAARCVRDRITPTPVGIDEDDDLEDTDPLDLLMERQNKHGRIPSLFSGDW